MQDKGLLPQGFILPDGTRRGRILAGTDIWQIIMTSAECSALIVVQPLYEKWIDDNLIGENLFKAIDFANSKYFIFVSGNDYIISSVQYGPYPVTNYEAHAFAIALRKSRKIISIPLHDALFIEQFSLLLPTYTNIDVFDDMISLGTWLSGGVRISVASSRRLCELVMWMSKREVKSIIEEAGFSFEDLDDSDEKIDCEFILPGRPELEKFFKEHIIDIVKNEEKYASMGVNFPSPIILYGPPGCGKTFAVDRLAEFLKWPRYDINSGSIGSPYIHDTSKKTAEIFEQAIHNAPSLVVIDEMEAFLSERSTVNAGSHHIEEVAEFLRRIPEASKNKVLVIAMTNMLEVIDPAILRRGRFDHIIEVKMPSSDEVEDLLKSLFEELPLANDVNIVELAKKLAGHPLSDPAFLVKEAGRLAARNSTGYINSFAIQTALETLLQNSKDKTRKIGF